MIAIGAARRSWWTGVATTRLHDVSRVHPGARVEREGLPVARGGPLHLWN